MKESLYEAKQEIKRADHLIFVSLKYTRTVDMFRSILERIINALDFTLDALLKYAKQKKKIKELPTSPGMKSDVVKEVYVEDRRITDMVELFLFLRRLLRAEYTKSQEYRRHVTMTVTMPEGEVEINIDIIHEYFEKLKEMVSYVETVTVGKNE